MQCIVVWPKLLFTVETDKMHCITVNFGCIYSNYYLSYFDDILFYIQRDEFNYSVLRYGILWILKIAF